MIVGSNSSNMLSVYTNTTLFVTPHSTFVGCELSPWPSSLPLPLIIEMIQIANALSKGLGVEITYKDIEELNLAD
jgi:hypothetical protein